jgi:hypothetical protein
MCNTRQRQVISKKNRQRRHDIFISYFFCSRLVFVNLEGGGGVWLGSPSLLLFSPKKNVDHTCSDSLSFFYELYSTTCVDIDSYSDSISWLPRQERCCKSLVRFFSHFVKTQFGHLKDHFLPDLPTAVQNFLQQCNRNLDFSDN